MQPTYIWHVGLGIGLGTRETRAHLTDAEISEWRAHVDRAAAAPDGDPIPGGAPYVMAAQVISGTLLCTVGRRTDGAPLCTFVVVVKSRHAAKAWNVLHDGYPEYEPSRGDVPRAPYCAVRAEYGLALDPAVGAWLDGYQVAVAWAWVIRESPS